ncbi:MICAL-like protein 1 [Physella acuta]|uniref:MICAL-like protein 1 n=1 Tax=Physella acuta TaxID=109671 RepID=UPI0027DC058E|nr:MICAL-like protein 1 [Physella acuta]XP_059176874.1 MICAL-like protein 1 [Physella acuta]
MNRQKDSGASKIEALRVWCKKMTEGYEHVNIVNFTTSWRNGMAFCALIHRVNPNLIDYDSLDPDDVLGTCQLAFEVAERELKIPAFLEAEDMERLKVPDKLSVITYLFQYYAKIHKLPLQGGPGVKGTKSRPAAGVKRPLEQNSALAPAVKKTSTEVKENVPAEKTTRHLPDAQNENCCVCHTKVYLLERHLEGGRLYHRSCRRSQKLSPVVGRTQKVSPSTGSDKKLPEVAKREPENNSLFRLQDKTKSDSPFATTNVQSTFLQNKSKLAQPSTFTQNKSNLAQPSPVLLSTSNSIQPLFSNVNKPNSAYTSPKDTPVQHTFRTPVQEAKGLTSKSSSNDPLSFENKSLGPHAVGSSLTASTFPKKVPADEQSNQKSAAASRIAALLNSKSDFKSATGVGVVGTASPVFKPKAATAAVPSPTASTLWGVKPTGSQSAVSKPDIFTSVVLKPTGSTSEGFKPTNVTSVDLKPTGFSPGGLKHVNVTSVGLKPIGSPSGGLKPAPVPSTVKTPANKESSNINDLKNKYLQNAQSTWNPPAASGLPSTPTPPHATANKPETKFTITKSSADARSKFFQPTAPVNTKLPTASKFPQQSSQHSEALLTLNSLRHVTPVKHEDRTSDNQSPDSPYNLATIMFDREQPLTSTDLKKKLDDNGKKFQTLEQRGRTLENEIRKDNIQSDTLIKKWFNLVSEKNELVREEEYLLDSLSLLELESKQESVESQLQAIDNVKVKSRSQKKSFKKLTKEKIALVQQRNDIVNRMEENRLRYQEEDEAIAAKLKLGLK